MFLLSWHCSYPPWQFDVIALSALQICWCCSTLGWRRDVRKPEKMCSWAQTWHAYFSSLRLHILEVASLMSTHKWIAWFGVWLECCITFSWGFVGPAREKKKKQARTNTDVKPSISIFFKLLKKQVIGYLPQVKASSKSITFPATQGEADNVDPVMSSLPTTPLCIWSVCCHSSPMELSCQSVYQWRWVNQRCPHPGRACMSSSVAMAL